MAAGPSMRSCSRTEQDGTLGRIQMGLALSAGKLTANAGRLLRVGGGTSLPSIVARRIDPRVLRKVVGASAARKIVVTGSNGKTTTCRMIAALAHAAGRRVTQNRAGSNLVQDVTSVAVNGADLLGTLDADVLLCEIDEAVMRHVVPEIEPDTMGRREPARGPRSRAGHRTAYAGS